jgi:hypothetical protein
METVCASCEVRTGLKVLLQVASISQLTVSRLPRQCGILNMLQPYRPPRPVTGIALLFTFTEINLPLLLSDLNSSFIGEGHNKCIYYGLWRVEIGNLLGSDH